MQSASTPTLAPNGSSLIYETYQQLGERVRVWCRTLPEFVAVAGVPRAGELVAAMIAAERNIHLVHLDDLLEGRTPWREPLRRNCRAKRDGLVLVVDDTVATGTKMRELRGKLASPQGVAQKGGQTPRHMETIRTPATAGRGQTPFLCNASPHVKLGAIYGKDEGLPFVDFCACRVGNVDHIFEWNWQHHWFVNRMLFDLDGVLSLDWPHTSEESELADAYQSHLTDASCLMRPSFEIGEIVTARLEQYRPQTARWLAQNGISYRTLTMAPFASAAERARSGGFAERKASIYRERSDAILFVESCPVQAETIARLTGRPVLSWPQNRLLNGITL